MEGQKEISTWEIDERAEKKGTVVRIDGRPGRKCALGGLDGRQGWKAAREGCKKGMAIRKYTEESVDRGHADIDMPLI